MHLICVGVSHRTAPIELREELSFTPAAIGNGLRQLLQFGFNEAAILSTCNRTELYALGPSALTAASLANFLANRAGPDKDRLRPHVYSHSEFGALRHLMTVACGLDSLVIGEPQIMGQVKDALHAAVSHQSAGPFIMRTFQAALEAGKRARTETGIAAGGFSIGHAAVDLAKSIFGSLKGRSILILGAGKMSELTAKHLVASGSSLVFVANRTLHKAESLADRLGGQAVDYLQFESKLANCDVVISSTAAPHAIVQVPMVSEAMRIRRGRPLFLIDIAVPRDIDPAVGELEDVFLYDIDDLQAVVEDQSSARKAEAVKVQTIVEEEVAKFQRWQASRSVAPVIEAIRTKAENARLAELDRLRRQLPDLDPKALELFNLASKSLATQLTREAILQLKESANAHHGDGRLVEAAETLFGLDRTSDTCPYVQEGNLP